MGSKNFSITLPEELYELVELARHEEQRSRSELIREALRAYFGRVSVENYAPLTRAQMTELKRRYKAYRENPDDLVPWEEAKGRIEKRLAAQRRS